MVGWLVVRLMLKRIRKARGSAGGEDGVRPMNKSQFARKRQLLWLYLRRGGRCSVCGQDVSPDDPGLSGAIPAALDIEGLLRLELTHSRCSALANGSAAEKQEAA